MRKVSYKIYTENGSFYHETTNYDLMRELKEAGYRVYTQLTEVPEFGRWADENGEDVAATYAEKRELEAEGHKLTYRLSNPLVTAIHMM